MDWHVFQVVRYRSTGDGMAPLIELEIPQIQESLER